MHLSLLVALLFAAAVSAEEVSNVQPVIGQPQPQAPPQQPGQVVPLHSVVEHAPAEQPGHVHAVGEAPHQHHQHQHQAPPPQQQQQHHYAPAGMIQLVAPPQYAQGVPAAQGAEQYGKPESASIPPNYKPFGSWGLYIGGNPADGYYTNYYKALGNTVDKQQVAAVAEQAAGAKPAGPAGPGAATASFVPSLRQATGFSSASSNYPYGSYADQVYPFDYYTPADLNSGSRVALVDQSSGPSVYAAASPVQVGSQVYGYGPEPQPMLSYGESYAATKRIGAQQSQLAMGGKGFERQQQQQLQQVQQVQQVEAPSKGYQQARYVYVQSPGMPQQYAQLQHGVAPTSGAGQAQVVAYPVPVGSQIVGSQPDTEGGYAPYGVHGYTRYAVKPTVVSSGEQQHQHQYQQGVHSAPMAHFPSYKHYGAPAQLHYANVPSHHQLHYSSVPVAASSPQQIPAGPELAAAVAPQGAPQGAQPAPLAPPVASPMEAASSDKSEARSHQQSPAAVPTASAPVPVPVSVESKPKEQIRA